MSELKVVNIPTGMVFEARILNDGTVEIERDGNISKISSQTYQKLYCPKDSWSPKVTVNKKKPIVKKVARRSSKPTEMKSILDYKEKVCDYVIKGIENVQEFGTYEKPDFRDLESWRTRRWEKKKKLVKIPRW